MLPNPKYTARPGLRLLISRDARGIIRRYSDPDTGETLTRNEGIRRMTLDQASGQLVDSFGNQIKLGELTLRRTHETPGLINASQTTSPLNVNPWTYKPKKNEEIIERLIVAGRDGKINKIDISHGAGKMYDPKARGGAWRRNISEALGLGENERLPTGDLKRMVIYEQIVVRRTFYK